MDFDREKTRRFLKTRYWSCSYMQALLKIKNLGYACM